MRWIEQFSLFLFDFDGLLVDSERLHFRAYVEMCGREGFLLPWTFSEFCTLAHYSATKLRDALYAELPDLSRAAPDWSVLYAKKREIYQTLIEQGDIALLPGVENLLATLQAKEYPRAVATNSTKSQVQTIRQNHPILDSIPLWITREDYAHPKPHPDAYLTAIEKMAGGSISKSKMVGFEDSLRGVMALQGAAVPPILICPSFHPQLSEHSLKGVPHFDSFEEISDEFIYPHRVP
jgi:HAD superfamily hydrolase (TIGR01509 family)